MRAALIVNRQAEHLRGGPLLEVFARAARDAKIEVVETRSLGELERAARHVKDADVVVLAGGDGSYSEGVSALDRAGSRAAIALAPGGTVSTVARNWGMRGAPASYARRLIAAIGNHRFHLTQRPTLRVGDRVGFIFGAGLVASFFREYYAREDRGYLAAARLVLPIFAGSFVGGALADRVLRPVPSTLVLDGQRRAPRAFSLVIASVVRDLGLGMRVPYRAGEEIGRFHAVASPLEPRELGPQMPRVLLGKRLRGDDHVDALAREMTLEFEGEAAYVLDGDLLPARSVRVTVGPLVRVVQL